MTKRVAKFSETQLYQFTENNVQYSTNTKYIYKIQIALMEILVKQITKEIDEKRIVFFLDEKGNEFKIDWAQPRFENIGFELKKNSKFNSKDFTYKGKCKLLQVGEGNEFADRHIFLNRQSKDRYYINEAEFKANFKKKVKKKKVEK